MSVHSSKSEPVAAADIGPSVRFAYRKRRSFRTSRRAKSALGRRKYPHDRSAATIPARGAPAHTRRPRHKTHDRTSRPTPFALFSAFMSGSWYDSRPMMSKWCCASTFYGGGRKKEWARKPSLSATTTPCRHASPPVWRSCAGMAPRGAPSGHFGAARTVLRYFCARDCRGLWTS